MNQAALAASSMIYSPETSATAMSKPVCAGDPDPPIKSLRTRLGHPSGLVRVYGGCDSCTATVVRGPKEVKP